MTKDIIVRQISSDELMQRIDELGILLQLCVAEGASVGFIMPFELNAAIGYWEDKVLPAMQEDAVVVLVAELAGRIIGTIQLDHNTMPNQRHRAEIRKLLIHPNYRRRGVARVLMSQIEAVARELNRSLLTLDTRTGDAAELLYRDLGFEVGGIIPDYCRDTHTARLDSTTVMYKKL